MDYEQITGEAITSKDHDLGEGRMTAKLYASKHMFCPQCQTCLDQTDTHVLEVHQGETFLKAFLSCGKCVETCREMVKIGAAGMNKSLLPSIDKLTIHELSWTGKTEIKMETA